MLSIVVISSCLLLVYWAYVIIGKESIPLALFVTLLFVPKINLVSVGGLTTAGIRIDDFVVVVLLLYAASLPSPRDGFLPKAIRIISVLIAVNSISLLGGIIFLGNERLLYSILVVVRHLEYFLLLPIGYTLIANKRISYTSVQKNLNLLFWMNLVIALLQIVGLCNYARSGVETLVWAGLPISTFNGYYEYGMYLCMMAVYYLNAALTQRRYTAYFLVAVIVLFMTNSRSTLAICLLIAVVMICRKFYRGRIPHFLWLGIFALVIGGCAIAILLASGSLDSIGRFGSESIPQEIQKMVNSFETGDFDSYKATIANGDEQQLYDSWYRAGGDLSSTIRFYKWGCVFDGFLENPIFGYGYGVTQVVDGNYFRLLGETGLIGLGVWLYLYLYYYKFVKARKANTVLSVSSMMVAVALGAIFIDMFDASKVMEMLWFLVGVACYSDLRRLPVSSGSSNYVKEAVR